MKARRGLKKKKKTCVAGHGTDKTAWTLICDRAGEERAWAQPASASVTVLGSRGGGVRCHHAWACVFGKSQVIFFFFYKRLFFYIPPNPQVSQRESSSTQNYKPRTPLSHFHPASPWGLLLGFFSSWVGSHCCFFPTGELSHRGHALPHRHTAILVQRGPGCAKGVWPNLMLKRFAN